MRIRHSMFTANALLLCGCAEGFQGHERRKTLSTHSEFFPSSRQSAFVVPQNFPKRSNRISSIRLAAAPKNDESVNGKGDRPISAPEEFLLAVEDMQDEDDNIQESKLSYDTTVSQLIQAGSVGAVTGMLVAIFKLSIETVRSVTYEQDLWVTYPKLLFLIPMLGGILVGTILYLGGPFPPGLRGQLQDVDDNQQELNQPSNFAKYAAKTQSDFVRKSSAAVFTLGTGCSLGPEGPCVEIGLNSARSCLQLVNTVNSTQELPVTFEGQSWNRILLSSGAAAGVAAGFNAPLAGVFFALEIMQTSFESIDQDKKERSGEGFEFPLSFTANTSITPILIACVLSALTAKAILGNQLIFQAAQGVVIQTPLVELPLYFMLGVMSGLISFIFTYLAKVSQSFFAGKWGPEPVRTTMSSCPDPVKPAIGGLLCGLIGLYYPQILFFGYETLNPLLKQQEYLPLTVIVALLTAKTIFTALSAGSGLVGGTFAPSLFLGSMTGALFRDGAAQVVKVGSSIDASTIPVLSSVVDIVPIPEFHLASAPAYAMVGAASVLAALFRAPLTGTLLLFEVTRNYDVLLPIMASAGVASIVSDGLEDTWERRDEMQRRDKDPVSWGDLADKYMDSMARSVSNVAEKISNK